MAKAPLVLLLAILPGVQDGKRARKDLYGDPLPADAIARMGTIRFRHGSDVDCAAFSPDGKRVASGGYDRLVVVWDIATGRPLATCRGHTSEVMDVAFSPDGNSIASVSHDGIRLWESSTGREVRKLAGSANRLLFSPDGREIVGGRGREIFRWRIETGERTVAVKVPGERCFLEEISTDGRKAIFRDGKTLWGWDVRADRSFIQLSDGDYQHAAVALSPDGSILALGHDEKVILRDVATGELLRASEKREWGASHLSFSPDGKLLATSDSDDSFSLCNGSTLEEDRRFRTRAGSIGRMMFSRDGSILALAGAQPTLQVVRVPGGEVLHGIEGHLGALTGIALSPDGSTLVTAGTDTKLILWEAGGIARYQVPGRFYSVASLAISKDGRRFAAIERGRRVFVCDATTGQELLEIEDDETGDCLALSPDGKTIACATSKKWVRLWDASSGKALRSIKGPGNVSGLAFSPDGKLLASGGEEGVLIWDTSSFAEVRAIMGNGSFQGLAISSDGRILSAIQSKTAWLWELPTGKELGALRTAGEDLNAVAFCPATGLLATGLSDGTIRFREVATGKERRRLVGHLGGVTSLSFSADGRLLASGSSDSTALLWDLSE